MSRWCAARMAGTSPPGWKIDVTDLPVSIAPGESVALKTRMSHDGPLFFPAPALEGVVEDAETGQQALRYDQFINPLIKAIQELEARVAALEGA